MKGYIKKSRCLFGVHLTSKAYSLDVYVGTETEPLHNMVGWSTLNCLTRKIISLMGLYTTKHETELGRLIRIAYEN